MTERSGNGGDGEQVGRRGMRRWVATSKRQHFARAMMSVDLGVSMPPAQ